MRFPGWCESWYVRKCPWQNGFTGYEKSGLYLMDWMGWRKAVKARALCLIFSRPAAPLKPWTNTRFSVLTAQVLVRIFALGFTGLAHLERTLFWLGPLGRRKQKQDNRLNCSTVSIPVRSKPMTTELGELGCLTEMPMHESTPIRTYQR